MFSIHPDITIAETLPAEFYRSREVFDQLKEKVFSGSWQLVANAAEVKSPGSVFPFMLLSGMLDEPLMITRDSNDHLHCISNVCTHRGNLVCEKGGVEKTLRCRYHGRKYQLDGKFLSMPEFDDVKNFPSEKDHLKQLPLHQWGSFLFTSIQPSFRFEEAFGSMMSRMKWLEQVNFIHSVHHSKEYIVNANWAIYCENYLEGFHIPYVHASLNQVLDYGAYTHELFRYSNLQVGFAKKGEETFHLPGSSPDFGKNIAAYYFWIFPNLMFNFYPWGLSVNVVRPIAFNQSKISFLTFIADPAKFEQGVAQMIDRVEREDEAIVENVQKGMQSRIYKSGRYSPAREKGTHHFHCLLTEFLNK